MTWRAAFTRGTSPVSATMKRLSVMERSRLTRPLARASMIDVKAAREMGVRIQAPDDQVGESGACAAAMRARQGARAGAKTNLAPTSGEQQKRVRQITTT